MKQKNKRLPELSMFFPAYNEAGNIEELVKQALAVAPLAAEKFEIILVDDGSTDATLPIARRLARRYKQVRVVTQENMGYGGALKRGFAEARYKWVFFSDADLQFDLSEITKLLAFAQGSDMVLGFRMNRAEGWKRHILALALKVWNKLFLAFPLRIKDIDCAFKLLNRRVVEVALPLISDGAMVSTELLLKAHRAGLSYSQVGVSHYRRRIGEQTGNDLRVIWRAVKDTFVLQRYFFESSLAGRLAKKQWRVARQMSLAFIGLIRV